MAYVGSFTVTLPNVGDENTRGLPLPFSTMNFDPPGATPDTLESIQEELTDTGVDGRRWRQIYRQFAPFTLMTTADATSYDNAILAKRYYQATKGAVGKLAVILDGITYTYSSVKVTDVLVRVQKGFLVGAAATSGSAAIVYGKWSMVLADVTKQGVS